LKWVVAQVIAILWATGAQAQSGVPQRPEIKFSRADENWGLLADQSLPTAPLDWLKYIPLDGEPSTYLSFGANLRERAVYNDAFLLGATGAPGDSFLLSSIYLHADLRLSEHAQAFVQLEHIGSTGQEVKGLARVSDLDVRQAFVGYRGRAGVWSYGLRIGRQELAFDQEHLVALHEGPNVRQTSDAIYAVANNGVWDFRLLASHPVQSRPGTFDDKSNGDFGFYALRIEHQLEPGRNISAYVGQLVRANARLGRSFGHEERNVLDLRYFQSGGPVQIDIEAMLQSGSIGPESIRAWAISLRGRHVLAQTPLQPTLGFQFDVGSGDHDPGDGKSMNFYPLFPNGVYFSQANYTGYANLVHTKATLSIRPTKKVSMVIGAGLQWRQTTRDAVYAQPSIVLPKTAGVAGRYSGRYGQIQLGLQLNHYVRLGVEGVYFEVAPALKRHGLFDGRYLGIDAAVSW
jgi:hypothetical protein